MPPLEAPAAKERQSTLNNEETASGKFPEASKGETRNKVGESVGVLMVMLGGEVRKNPVEIYHRV